MDPSPGTAMRTASPGWLSAEDACIEAPQPSKHSPCATRLRAVLRCSKPLPAFRSAFRQARQGRETRPALALPKCLGRPASLESSRRGWLAAQYERPRSYCCGIAPKTPSLLMLLAMANRLTDHKLQVRCGPGVCREPHGRPGVLSGTLSARQTERLLVATGRFLRLSPLMDVDAARSYPPLWVAARACCVASRQAPIAVLLRRNMESCCI